MDDNNNIVILSNRKYRIVSEYKIMKANRIFFSGLWTLGHCVHCTSLSFYVPILVHTQLEYW